MLPNGHLMGSWRNTGSVVCCIIWVWTITGSSHGMTIGGNNVDIFCV